MKELIHRRPPDRSRQGMSVAFWLTVGQQEEIWKRFLSSSRSSLKSEQYKRDLATGLVEKQREAGGNMKELIQKQPPDRNRPGMSRAFGLTVEQQEYL